jgi:excisionase family DNA binding protein
MSSRPGQLSTISARSSGADGLLTPQEVAERLKATLRFVRRLVAERRIEYIRVGRLVRFDPEAVAAYIDRNRVAPLSRNDLRNLWRAA